MIRGAGTQASGLEGSVVMPKKPKKSLESSKKQSVNKPKKAKKVIKGCTKCPDCGNARCTEDCASLR